MKDSLSEQGEEINGEKLCSVFFYHLNSIYDYLKYKGTEK